MKKDEFKKHLFAKIWSYAITQEHFNTQYVMSMQMETDFYWDPEDFYAAQIVELLNALKDNYEFSNTFTEIKETLDNKERPVIMDFVSWFDLTSSLSFLDIYTRETYGEGIYQQPLIELVNYVKSLGPPPAEEKNDDISDALVHIFKIFRRFKSNTSALTERRAKKTSLEIVDEYDVQDFLQVMLRPYFPDIRSEVVVDGKVDRHFLKTDFLISKEKLAIECKFNKTKNFNSLKQQIQDDIMNYSAHPDCENIVFLIYDKNHLINNADELEKHFTGKMDILDNPVNVYLKIEPKN